MNRRASVPNAALSEFKAQERTIPAILGFFALAFAWSWSIGFWAQSTTATSPILGTSLAMLSGFGPSFAGFLIVALFSDRLGFRDWVAQCLNWRINWRWYAVAFCLPPVIMLLALGVSGAMGGIIPVSPAIGHVPLAIANFALVFMVGGPLGEEFGWRGFALPALAVLLNWRVASVLLGLIWGLWHLPLFFMANTPQEHMPIFLFIVSTTAQSVMFAWLFVNTGGSVIPALVMHTSVNAWMNIIPVLPTHGSLQPLMLMTAIQAIIALALLLLALPGRASPAIARPPC